MEAEQEVLVSKQGGRTEGEFWEAEKELSILSVRLLVWVTEVRIGLYLPTALEGREAAQLDFSLVTIPKAPLPICCQALDRQNAETVSLLRQKP